MKTCFCLAAIVLLVGLHRANAQIITLLNPTPQNADQFGYSVAAVGTDKVVVGTPLDNTGAGLAGAAYLFSTNGTLLTTFTNPAPASNDRFGIAVAGVGTDKVLVGAYFDDAGASDAGSAYLFSTNGTLLTTITNPTPLLSDNFGGAVAGIGTDKFLIAAYLDNTGATDAGTVYIYSTNGTLLVTITNPAPATMDAFGISVVAVGTDKVLIGASLDDTGATDAGTAYLFSTNGTLLTTITNPTPQAGDNFGSSVAAVGTDKLVIGAYFDNAVGAAYLYNTNGTLLITYTNPTPQSSDFFGYNVGASSAGKIIIGAYRDNTGASFTGAAYLFTSEASTLVYTMTNPTPANQDGFGISVAAVGPDRALIGSYGDDVSATDAGVAYIFSPSSRPIIGNQPQSQVITVTSNVTFTVVAVEAGIEALSYQWRFNATDIPDGTNASYIRTNAQFADSGSYTVVITNVFGSVTSSAAVLTVSPFFNITAGLPGVTNGSVAWGDYDNDGRLDILLIGTTNGNISGEISQVWRNTAIGFSNINAGLTIVGGPGAWGDYNNDGQLDILLTGFSHNVTNNYDEPVSQVWRNTGSGFGNINAGLSGIHNGSAAWGDYDNDGRPDILLLGKDAIESTVSRVSRNTASGFTDINIGLTGSSATWGDFDNDGLPDILLTGSSNQLASGAFSQIWRNTGGGFNNLNAGLPGVYPGAVACGDYDNDGRLDILLTGPGTNGIAISQVWRNTGSGFTNLNAGLPGVTSGSIAWGDYDADGRPDILLTGQDTNIVAISQVWRNTGSGFTNVNAGLTGVVGGSVAWGDYDNDGRLDILLTGQSSTGAVAQVLRNNFQGPTNTVPSTPSGLTAMIFGTNLTLNWVATADTQTPSAGLTYNIRVGNTPGEGNVVGPMAASTGYRRLVQVGNAGSRLTAIIPALPGRTNFYSVQAVDSSYAGSAFSSEASVKVLQWETPLIIVPLTVPALPVGDYNGNGVLDESELNAVLTNYFAQSPWLYLTNVAGLGGTNVTFALTNSIAGTFSVEYSTNLVDWQFLGPAVPRYLFTDTNAPAAPQRFYRLRWP